ncbi:hypothetical protein BDV36DRAFT_282047 [Aspergillus pseudocaelatus]|uniref:Amino acid/polyamine transporter I n=1 Tax=Aspergillus pseudocaelatus TaxID=1825620 RepID=A0ABQ6WVB6_9EURO|nr:hypothetical protein BDV36DRAFT_282047 [Aspergillus pseudocaelatus]
MAVSVPGQAKKQLNGITLLCMAFVICNSWAGIAGSLQLALRAGGPATLVYSILVATSAYLSIAASLAELAAVYPTAGGQYHFASILAPKRWRRGLSYTCGLLSLFSWLAIGVSVASIAAQQLLAIVSTSISGFEPKTWHVFLVYQGFALFAMLYTAIILKRNPWTHNIACYLHMLTSLRWIPFVVMEQGFRSRTIAIAISSVTIILSLTIIIATQEASSRLAWSLARDDGLLFSRRLQQLHPQLDIPLWSLLLVWILTFLCGFIYLASQTDYTCVILGTCFLIGLANWWLHGKARYNGPVMDYLEASEPEPSNIFPVQSHKHCKSGEVGV